MDPAILIGSLVAILSLAGCARLLYGAPGIITESAVRRAFWRSYPDIRVDTVSIDAAAQNALLITDQGPALVESLGDKLVCRLLTDGTHVKCDGQKVKIALADFTAPFFVYNARTSADAQHIYHLLMGAVSALTLADRGTHD